MMSRPFANNNGKTTFAQIKQTSNAGDYTHKKSVSYSRPKFCCSNKYPPYSINTTQLYINLLTNLDLENVIVMSDLSGNTYPVKINTSPYNDPYLLYNIDPHGKLFGNTVCGINNFEQYIRCNNSNT